VVCPVEISGGHIHLLNGWQGSRPFETPYNYVSVGGIRYENRLQIIPVLFVGQGTVITEFHLGSAGQKGFEGGYVMGALIIKEHADIIGALGGTVGQGNLQE